MADPDLELREGGVGLSLDLPAFLPSAILFSFFLSFFLTQNEGGSGSPGPSPPLGLLRNIAHHSSSRKLAYFVRDNLTRAARLCFLDSS